MSREWKPGDVASVLMQGSQPAFRTDKGWTYIDGSTGDAHADQFGFRPLVVIDPESLTVPRDGGAPQYGPKDLAHTLRLLVKADHDGEQTYRAQIVSELADVIDPPTPPKPDEPQGLGAVVEDVFDHVFIRLSTSWFNINEDQHCAWVHIAAVRVLSEGVTP